MEVVKYGRCPTCRGRAKKGVITYRSGKNKGYTRVALYCKPCMKKSNDERRSYRRDWHRRKKYGLTDIDIQKLKVKQKGRCRICKRKLPKDVGKGRHYFHVDHCHRSGRVRGLLCFHCNTGLGHFKDNVRLLKSAIVYLRAA